MTGTLKAFIPHHTILLDTPYHTLHSLGALQASGKVCTAGDIGGGSVGIAAGATSPPILLPNPLLV